MTPGDAAVSVCMSAGKVIAEQADRIAELEAKVRELEAIDAARTNAVQEAIDNAAIYQDQLTASRQQVERLATLLSRYRNETPLGHQPHMSAHEADEALAAVEKEPKP